MAVKFNKVQSGRLCPIAFNAFHYTICIKGRPFLVLQSSIITRNSLKKQTPTIPSTLLNTPYQELFSSIGRVATFVSRPEGKTICSGATQASRLFGVRLLVESSLTRTSLFVWTTDNLGREAYGYTTSSSGIDTSSEDAAILSCWDHVGLTGECDLLCNGHFWWQRHSKAAGLSLSLDAVSLAAEATRHCHIVKRLFLH
jgi:hypothetical protein